MAEVLFTPALWQAGLGIASFDNAGEAAFVALDECTRRDVCISQRVMNATSADKACISRSPWVQ
jgi:hypothetical protein